MLTDFHGTLRGLLYDRGLIDRADVDIAFDAPARPWIGGRTRPTLNFFLYDIEENTDLRNTGMQTARGNGVAVHRMPPRRFDLRFMVSAITNEIDDEHLLLWRALVTLMKYPTIPTELLPDVVRGYDLPVATKVTKPNDSPRPLDIWSALGRVSVSPRQRKVPRCSEREASTKPSSRETRRGAGIEEYDDDERRALHSVSLMWGKNVIRNGPRLLKRAGGLKPPDDEAAVPQRPAG